MEFVGPAAAEFGTGQTRPCGEGAYQSRSEASCRLRPGALAHPARGWAFLGHELRAFLRHSRTRRSKGSRHDGKGATPPASRPSKAWRRPRPKLAQPGGGRRLTRVVADDEALIAVSNRDRFI